MLRLCYNLVLVVVGGEGDIYKVNILKIIYTEWYICYNKSVCRLNIDSMLLANLSNRKRLTFKIKPFKS